MKKEIHTLNVLNRIPSIQEKDVKALELKKAIAEMEEKYKSNLKKAIAEQGSIISVYKENTLLQALYYVLDGNDKKASINIISVLEEATKKLSEILKEQCQQISI